MFFDLETAIAAWRRPYEVNPTFSVEDVDELEGSLRDRIEALMEKGLSEKAAFRSAVKRAGSYGRAETEYRKVYWGKVKREHRLKDELIWRLSMLKNYVIIALRTLRKQKGYAFINIAGLVIGLACFMLILLFVQHELSYDQFHEKADRIYRVARHLPGRVFLGSDYYAVTPASLASTLEKEYPEVASATSIKNQRALLGLGKQHVLEEGLLADAHFLDVFTFPLRLGDAKTALIEPNSILLTESLARKIFGDVDPLGRTLLYQNQDIYTVTGIIPDVPGNSSLRFTFIASAHSNADYLRDTAGARWNNNSWHTFFVLTQRRSAAQLQAKMPALVEKYIAQEGDDPATHAQLILQPFQDVHLRSYFNFDIGGRGSITYVYLFAAIGLVILLLACINYTNLAVARSIKRTREVGLRKVVGAGHRQLIGQFLGESVLMTALALVLALGLVHLLLPFFGHLVERPLRLDYAGNGLLLPGLLALVGLVGLLSGSYPAFFMASLRPIEVLTGKTDRRATRFRAQRLLIVGQYAISIALVVGSVVIYRQMQYMQQKELGYDREHIVTVRVQDAALHQHYTSLREEWLRNPQIVAVTSSGSLPTNIDWRQQIRGWAGSSEDDQLPIYRFDTGYDFLEVFGMEVIAGRSFSREVPTDIDEGCLINEATARALGWTLQEAIGKQFIHDNIYERTVIGVVKDFHMHSMHLTIEPLIILLNPDQAGYISAKVRPDNLTETIASLERSMKQFSPYPFEYQFLDEHFDQLYKAELHMGEMFGFFTILALLIASLGLFGLAAYTAQQRTKEISVRKVLGASVVGIVALLSKDFLKLVALAVLIATPLAYVAMQRWLEGFAYRIEIGPGLFVLTGVLVVLIALLTVSYQSIRAALADPVKSLRYE